MVLQALQEAEQNGVGHVDPVEFAYLQRLASRADALPERPKQKLFAKVDQRLQILVDEHQGRQTRIQDAFAQMEELGDLDDDYVTSLKAQFSGHDTEAVADLIQAIVERDVEKNTRAKARLQDLVARAQLDFPAESAAFRRDAKSLLQQGMRADFAEQAHRLANRLELLRLEQALKVPRAQLSLGRMQLDHEEEAGLYNPEVLVTRAVHELNRLSLGAGAALFEWARDYAQLAMLLGDDET